MVAIAPASRQSSSRRWRSTARGGRRCTRRAGRRVRNQRYGALAPRRRAGRDGPSRTSPPNGAHGPATSCPPRSSTARCPGPMAAATSRPPSASTACGHDACEQAAPPYVRQRHARRPSIRTSATGRQSAVTTITACPLSSVQTASASCRVTRRARRPRRAPAEASSRAQGRHRRLRRAGSVLLHEPANVAAQQAEVQRRVGAVAQAAGSRREGDLVRPARVPADQVDRASIHRSLPSTVLHADDEVLPDDPMSRVPRGDARAGIEVVIGAPSQSSSASADSRHRE